MDHSNKTRNRSNLVAPPYLNMDSCTVYRSQVLYFLETEYAEAQPFSVTAALVLPNSTLAQNDPKYGVYQFI